jgi:hypothetical protein
MTISGIGGVVGEGVDLTEGVAPDAGEFPAECIVGNDGEGISEAGDVPGLAGREQGDGAFGEVFRQVDRREMGCGRFIEDEVAMNFIRDRTPRV